MSLLVGLIATIFIKLIDVLTKSIGIIILVWSSQLMPFSKLQLRFIYIKYFPLINITFMVNYINRVNYRKMINYIKTIKIIICTILLIDIYIKTIKNIKIIKIISFLEL